MLFRYKTERVLERVRHANSCDVFAASDAGIVRVAVVASSSGYAKHAGSHVSNRGLAQRILHVKRGLVASISRALCVDGANGQSLAQRVGCAEHVSSGCDGARIICKCTVQANITQLRVSRNKGALELCGGRTGSNISTRIDESVRCLLTNCEVEAFEAAAEGKGCVARVLIIGLFDTGLRFERQAAGRNTESSGVWNKEARLLG